MPWVIGAGKTCQRLWEAIPQGYRQGHCFTDFWAAYAAVIAEQQHTAVGNETGETAHVEHWNNTLRQRLARFVRMTLSFSKSAVMLRPPACFSFFIATIPIGPSCSSEPLPTIDPNCSTETLQAVVLVIFSCRDVEKVLRTVLHQFLGLVLHLFAAS